MRKSGKAGECCGLIDSSWFPDSNDYPLFLSPPRYILGSISMSNSLQVGLLAIRLITSLTMYELVKPLKQMFYSTFIRKTCLLSA